MPYECIAGSNPLGGDNLSGVGTQLKNYIVGEKLGQDRDFAHDRQVSQEGFGFSCAYFNQMPLVMKQNEAANPVKIGIVSCECCNA